MKLSVLVPAHNEGGGIATTLLSLHGALRGGDVPHELLVVADHCTDDTEAVLARLQSEIPTLRIVINPGPAGYGFAVRAGLDAYGGDAVVIVMADSSDDPRDVVAYYRKLLEGYDCVFGSRFGAGATVRNYPASKLILNRIANRIISAHFRLHYHDATNAFKCFRREVIDGVRPLLACHFNLTVELPLKAIVRGYSWTVIPTNWYGRESGETKFGIQEMGSRYLFIVLYVLIEKYFSRGDYKRAASA